MSFAVRPTDRCNLNCDYCYARVADPKDMSPETLRLVLQRIADSYPGHVTISWTGGEPLLMGPDFFQLIAELQAELPQVQFTNILQTNLTLLQDWVIAFLSTHKWQVRTSLDLPPANHDELRIKGNFNATMMRIRRLQEAGVPVNINTVVTSKNVDATAEIYQFLNDNKINSFSVSRFILQGNGVQNAHLAIKESTRFGRFLIELFDLWISDPSETKIQKITPLNTLMEACEYYMRGEVNPEACFHCQNQVYAIGPTGDIYPSCNKFFGLPGTCLGNISELELAEVTDSPERVDFLEQVKKVGEKVCIGCQYMPICRGGCYYVAFATLPELDRITKRDQFCKGYYLVFDHIIDYLQKMRRTEEATQ